MDILAQVFTSGMVVAILWFQVRNVDSKVEKIMNNHLKHIADDVTDIKIRIAVLEDHDK